MSDTTDRTLAAERMRREADGYRNNERMYGHVSRIDTAEIPGLFQDLATFVGLRGYIRSDALFDTLSDLIDPICHMTEIGKTPKERKYVCSNCGATNVAPVCHERPRYCCCCGHRAVSFDRVGSGAIDEPVDALE